MKFLEEIKNLSYDDSLETYLLNINETKVLLTAVHTMAQKRITGKVKLNETLTKEITRYVASKTNASTFIKIKDTGIETNSENMDDFKIKLLDVVAKNDIKLVVDIHGASINRKYDVEIGTLDFNSASKNTIMQMENAFHKYNINNIVHNETFKGGGITKALYRNTSCEAIQIEINKRYRDINNEQLVKDMCNALIEFINIYNNQ